MHTTDTRPHTTRAKYPLGPLLQRTGQTPTQIAHEAGKTDRAGRRWKANGILRSRAQDLAWIYGWDATDIWPNWK